MKQYIKNNHYYYLYCWLQNSANSQDINFSQFYELPLLRNPALGRYFFRRYQGNFCLQKPMAKCNSSLPYIGIGLEYKKPIGQNSDDFITIRFTDYQ